MRILLVLSTLLSCSPSDADGDGFTVEQGDCNDERPGFHPGASDYVECEPETCFFSSCACSNVEARDQNCDGLDGADHDGDGYVSEESGGDDCDDNNINVNPGRRDPSGDAVDADCNGVL